MKKKMNFNVLAGIIATLGALANTLLYFFCKEDFTAIHSVFLVACVLIAANSFYKRG
ncbi:MAG: hypothetical protein IPQ04_11475 [Saprospiraceae bacterium]|nr:hypothetical protein [Saprospiraceae bacterium]